MCLDHLVNQKPFNFIFILFPVDAIEGENFSLENIPVLLLLYYFPFFFLLFCFLLIFYLFFFTIHFTDYLDIWQPLNASSVLMDSSISNFEVVQVSRDISNDFTTAKDFCLSGKKWITIILQGMLVHENGTLRMFPSLLLFSLSPVLT